MRVQTDLQNQKQHAEIGEMSEEMNVLETSIHRLEDLEEEHQTHLKEQLQFAGV